jgi:hypothetical protein
MSVVKNLLPVLAVFGCSMFFSHQTASASDIIELDDPFPPEQVEYKFSGKCDGKKYELVWQPSHQGGKISSYHVNGRLFDGKVINEFLNKNKSLGGISDIDIKGCSTDRLSTIFLITLLKLESGTPRTSFMKVTISSKGNVIAVVD